MSYDLKKENRKKFQDKTKLKRHHKKNYAKVVPKEESKDDISTTSGQTLPTNTDTDASQVPSRSRSNSSGETPLGEEGQPLEPEVPSNTWRYEEEITIHGHDDANEDLVNQIDFKKLYLKKDIDLPQRKQTRDEFLDDLLRQPHNSVTATAANDYEYEPPKPSKVNNENEFIKTPMSQLKKQTEYKNDAPSHLKPDEDFLDGLI